MTCSETAVQGFLFNKLSGRRLLAVLERDSRANQLSGFSINRLTRLKGIFLM